MNGAKKESFRGFDLGTPLRGSQALGARDGVGQMRRKIEEMTHRLLSEANSI